MRTLKVGVIGCGIISSTHLDAIKKNPMASLVVVCDIDLHRAKTTAARYNCRFTNHVNELIEEDLDVIHVLTPHFTHFEIAKSIIESGKHCLLEKPMTINSKEAYDLVKITDTYQDLKLGIVFQNRLNTTSQYIRSAILQNRYGKLLGMRASVTWLRDKNYYAQGNWRGKWSTEGGGVLINQAIHTLDLLQWFGGEIESISGSYGTFVLMDDVEVEDTATMVIHFNNKSRGLLYATNNYVTNSPIEMEFVFEQGILSLNDSKLYLKKQNEIEFLCEDITATGEKAYWGLGHEMLINQFYDSIIQDNDHYISVREAAQSIEILDQFYKFANKNEKIKVRNTKEW